jgi:hypothetical protein
LRFGSSLRPAHGIVDFVYLARNPVTVTTHRLLGCWSAGAAPEAG